MKNVVEKRGKGFYLRQPDSTASFARFDKNVKEVVFNKKDEIILKTTSKKIKIDMVNRGRVVENISFQIEN